MNNKNRKDKEKKGQVSKSNKDKWMGCCKKLMMKNKKRIKTIKRNRENN